jgi:hypothetical protein
MFKTAGTKFTSAGLVFKTAGAMFTSAVAMFKTAGTKFTAAGVKFKSAVGSFAPGVPVKNDNKQKSVSISAIAHTWTHLYIE